MHYAADVAIAMLVFATLAGAYSWLGSYAGVVSFGHAVFFGTGAYAVAVSNLRGGSPWYGALGGALAAVLLAALCGLLFLRGRGFTFALVTLVFGASAEPFVAAHAWVGAGNTFHFPLRPSFLNLQFSAAWPYVLLAVMVFGVMLALTLALRVSRIGAYLQALRTNPAAAAGVGVSAGPPRLLALIASAFFTSVAGSFFAEYRLGVAPPAFFSLALSLDIALIGLMAGARTAWGAPLAGIVYALVASIVPLHPPGVFGSVVLAGEGVVICLLAAMRLPGAAAAGAFRRARLAAGSTA